MLTANGFDAQHFQYVHDRRLLEPVKVDEPAPFARRMSYRAEVSGNSIFDVLLRRFVGRTVEITITSYGGPLVLVTGNFASVRSRIFISVRPLTPETTLTEVMVYAPLKTRLPFLSWTNWLNLWIRRWFTWGFMFSDFERLQGIRYNPSSLIESDGPMIDFFRWAAELPRDVVWQDTPRARCAMTESCVAQASTDGHSQLGTQSWMPQQKRLSSSVQS
jgi:hypothetical protein